MQAFARSMDEYFSDADEQRTLHTRGGEGVPYEHLESVKRSESKFAIPVYNPTTGTSTKVNLSIPYLIYYITIMSLMDMTLQFSFPSQKNASQRFGFSIKSFSGFALFINAVQVIMFFCGLYVMIKLAFTIHRMEDRKSNDFYIDIPMSLLLVGNLISISILLNALNYNQLLTTGASVVLNLPRVLCIIGIIYCILHDEQTTKKAFLGILLVWSFITACAGPTAPETAHGMGIVGFIAGIGFIGASIYIDFYGEHSKKLNKDIGHKSYDDEMKSNDMQPHLISVIQQQIQSYQNKINNANNTSDHNQRSKKLHELLYKMDKKYRPHIHKETEKLTNNEKRNNLRHQLAAVRNDLEKKISYNDILM